MIGISRFSVLNRFKIIATKMLSTNSIAKNIPLIRYQVAPQRETVSVKNMMIMQIHKIPQSAIFLKLLSNNVKNNTTKNSVQNPPRIDLKVVFRYAIPLIMSKLPQ